ncbi:MAG: dipeptidase [Promethearchaeota archaeon]
MVNDLVIDCHADTLWKKYSIPLNPLLFAEKQELHASKDLLLQGKVDIQVFAIFIPPKLEKIGVEATLEMISLAREWQKDGFTLIKSKNDFQKLNEKRENEIGMILSLEGTVALERNLQLLPIFYELGIRNIGLSWSRKNLFCEGTGISQSENEMEGLSMYGKQLLEQMETLGIVVDISHLNKKGVTDVAKITNKPYIASHSNAYNICPVDRNLTDDQLRLIADADGVVGINFYPRFLSKEDPKKVTILNVIEHVKYITDLIGIRHVGLGSDFDGIGTTPKGLENASKIKDIPYLLEKEGFSKQDISKVMGGNFQRVFLKVWK